MKKLLFLLLLLCACQIKIITPDNAQIYNGKTVYCSDFGCREITGFYFYDQDNHVVYYDPKFEVWIGYYGYWINHTYYRGFWSEYYQLYYPYFYNGKS